MADTPDQKVADHLAGAAEGRIFRLQQEREELLRAQDRIAEIDAELAILQAEKTRLDPRRPPRNVPSPPIDEPPGGGVRLPDVKTARK